ncbi:MAG: WG repeat-containing protein [Lachnospiraceae bacterium]|nr:WG repeat-containing protein [Lachnospiraceae bacterium]
MKGYKFLVPVFLIVIYVASIYTLGDDRKETADQYNAYLAAAREFRELDLRVDAEAYYEAALDVSASMDLYLEIGEYYQETGQSKKALSWGETITDTYPKEKEGYEYLIQIYYDNLDIAACFSVYDEANSREVQSDIIDSIISEFLYTYYFLGGYDDVGIFSENLCPVSVGGKWGYAGTKASLALGYNYSEAGYFYESRAAVVDTSGDAYFIDTSGNKRWVVSDIDNVVSLGMMIDNIFPLYNGSQWFFCNKSNELILGGYEEVTPFLNQVAAVKTNDGWMLIDESGKDLTGKTYDEVVMDEKKQVYANDRLFVCEGSKYYMIDSSGKVIGDSVYEDAHIFNGSTYAAVKLDGKWGFTDKDGNLVIEAQYEDARSFLYGYAAVKVDGKWGFIDTDGNLVIEAQFDGARDFTSRGTVFVQTDGLWKMLCLYRYNH